jgi:hypothetical protein
MRVRTDWVVGEAHIGSKGSGPEGKGASGPLPYSRAQNVQIAGYQ